MRNLKRLFTVRRCLPKTNRSISWSVFIVLFVFTTSQFVTNTLYFTWDYFHNVHMWSTRQTVLCGGNFTGYAQKFFRMRSALYSPDTDSFQIFCRNGKLPPSYSFIDNGHGVEKYISRIDHMTKSPSRDFIRHDDVTVIVDRVNSHNYYHTMQDWYNLYLISKFFKLDFKTMQVFLIDKSPAYHTDKQWEILFPKLTKRNETKHQILFKDAIFNMPGPANPMEYWYRPDLPYVEEFSQTFLSYFGLTNQKPLNCKNLTITLVIRRDYFLHPETDFLYKRNAQRKFKNEKELVQTLRSTYAGHTISTLVAEDMSLQEQLKLVVNTDILIGMHGCALTNTLFMPRHGAIFEMYPKYWNIKRFFSAIAGWRGIQYRYWRNEIKENEFPDHYTYIPLDIFTGNIDQLISSIGCKM